MSSNKLKISLVVLGIAALDLAALSFFVGSEAPAVQEFSSVGAQEKTNLTIDFGNGGIKTFRLKPDGSKSLLQLMKETLEKDGVVFSYKTYTGLGELVTQIGDKKSGADGKYWQFWVNGSYAQVGASSYVVNIGDIIEWRFSDEKQ